jgi:PD-(D/E)XK nuclease superfamily
MIESPDERLGLLSASALPRAELCPGSFQLEREARRLNQLAHQDSPAAQRGSLIHAYLAGQPDEDGAEIGLTDPERTTADFLQERAQGEVQRIFGDQPVRQSNEKRYWLLINGQKMLSGRVDRVVHTDTVALVQDFKTGWSEPDPAEQNSQMKALAVLVALQLLPTVRKVIVQVISGPFGVSEAAYDYPALAKAYNDVLRTLKAIQDPLAPLNPSPEACRYCPAINICQAVKGLAPSMKEAQALPDGLRASELLDSVEVLQKRLDAIREYYAARLSADPAYDLPGYAMVPGAVRREVTDWEAARRRLGEWLELEDIEGAANYRLGDLEKALGKKLKIRGKELKERMNTILEGLVEERSNAASLRRVKSEPKVLSLA